MRGFPQFTAAASRLQAENKDLHVRVAGGDRVHYGPKLAAGQSFKAQALAEHMFDKGRLRFFGSPVQAAIPRSPSTQHGSCLFFTSVHCILAVGQGNGQRVCNRYVSQGCYLRNYD